MEGKKKSTIKFRRGVYINREYSWLAFNKRVLEQALDETNPILERCKFLSIFCSNLDEFFMVRIGSLYNDSISNPLSTENKTKLTNAQQIEGLLPLVEKLYKTRYAVYTKIKRQLKVSGVNLLDYDELSPTRLKYVKQYFDAQILPFLSPMVIDAKHPMIRFENLSSYMLFKLKKGENIMIGVMQINSKIAKLLPFAGGKKVSLITTEQIVRNLGHRCFPNYKVEDSMMVRVTRNADFESAVEDADIEYNYDFSRLLKSKVETRLMQHPVRIEYSGQSKTLKKFLMSNLNVEEQCMFKVNNFDYKYMFSLARYMPKNLSDNLSYEPFKQKVDSRIASSSSMIELVRQGDVMLAYPFDSMEPLIKLLGECAVHPDCVSIRITIYRLASHSRIVEALKLASEKGKEVTVVMELCARFDEENNMYYANVLREAGCNVIYGMDNYKVHSKIISIVFSKDGDISYITHLGTGNYNESTAKQYTDLNIITANQQIGLDGTAFFRNISICNIEDDYQQLLIAPKYFKKKIIQHIDEQIALAQEGKPASIIAKMNSLADKPIIDKLVQASVAGVKVDLIVRGICCLSPGKVGKTDNIRVVSIVGRFLEHSRVYCFGCEGSRTMYISSADLMTRNTDKRVEIGTPILDSKISCEIFHMLQVMLRDNVKGRQMQSNGTYRVIEQGEQDALVNSQEHFLL